MLYLSGNRGSGQGLTEGRKRASQGQVVILGTGRVVTPIQATELAGSNRLCGVGREQAYIHCEKNIPPCVCVSMCTCV